MFSNFLEIRAKLTLYPTHKGGRKTGIKTGYRPNHVFEYKENPLVFITSYIGQIDFNKDMILPGETANVMVKFLNHNNIESFLKKGRVWWIHEGENTLGEAEVLEIID
ncbi:hypothetical protein [Gaetbulibacter aestuarii]|uniref:Elongation factor Tu n=1 Tax=Gaetbulibacter aestuarii TaxID=1502358 RepID=A0ABW7MW34_9FLAO